MAARRTGETSSYKMLRWRTVRSMRDESDNLAGSSGRSVQWRSSWRAPTAL
jgi:hypothetical protein